MKALRVLVVSGGILLTIAYISGICFIAYLIVKALMKYIGS